MKFLKLFNKKLDYTEEMKKQDELWETESEDTSIMENLFNNIVEQAKQKGFNGYYLIYQANNECICEIYNDEEETEFMFGNCRALIKCLEEYYLNK